MKIVSYLLPQQKGMCIMSERFWFAWYQVTFDLRQIVAADHLKGMLQKNDGMKILLLPKESL